MYKVLIVTHAELAEGFKAAIEFTTRSSSHITCMSCFTAVPDPEAEVERYFAALSEEDEVVVLTDLMAGSVNQIFIRQMEKRRFHLLTGINLPLALEVALADRFCYEDIQKAICTARDGIRYVNDEVEQFKSSGETGGNELF